MSPDPRPHPSACAATRASIRQRFDRAASRYDEGAALHREVGERLLQRLDYIKLQPQRILDLGSGTGAGSLGLRQRYPQATIVAVDLSSAMIEKTLQQHAAPSRRLSVLPAWGKKSGAIHGLCADMARLPVADNSMDLIHSNLSMQWLDDFASAAREFQRVLRKGGLLMFSSFGPDTLKELRHSWSAVDQQPHVNEFTDMHDLGDDLLHARFAEPVMDMEMFTLLYQDAAAVMRDLKLIGANTVLDQHTVSRKASLGGRKRLRALSQAYEKYRNKEGLLPATFEVVYGHGWIGPDTAPERTNKTQPHSVAVPFSDIHQGR